MPALFALWTFLIDPSIAGGISEYPSVERCGLVEPSSFKFSCMACVYAGYHAMQTAQICEKLTHTFEVRLTNMFHPLQVDFGNSISLSRCEVALNKCRSAEVLKILKCWTDGWATGI